VLWRHGWLGARFRAEARPARVWQVLGTREIYILHHSDCGLTKFTTVSILGRVKAALGWLGAAALLRYGAAPTFAPGDDALEQSVRDDVASLCRSRVLLKGTPVVGLALDTASGRLREVARGRVRTDEK
jgi:carbonic anhydrase